MLELSLDSTRTSLKVPAACTMAYAVGVAKRSRPERRTSESGFRSPSIDEALALVPDRFAVVKQRARRCALQEGTRSR